MYVENFTVVPWRTLGKPFLFTPTNSLIAWRSPLIFCSVRLMKIKSSINKSFVSIVNLLVFISSSIRTVALPSSEISNFFFCLESAKTQSPWEFHRELIFGILIIDNKLFFYKLL